MSTSATHVHLAVVRFQQQPVYGAAKRSSEKPLVEVELFWLHEPLEACKTWSSAFDDVSSSYHTSMENPSYM